MEHRTRRRMIIGTLALLAVVGGFLWMMDDRFTPQRQPDPVGDSIAAIPATPESTRVITAPPDTTTIDTASAPLPPDTTFAGAPASPYDPPTPPPSAGGTVPRSLTIGRLLLPVAGIRPDQLVDTYTDARSEGRVHNAIDIIAPHDAPVLAAADGYVVKLFQSERGGTTIYQLGTDSTTIFYYAHLDHYADNLVEGHFARRGEVIGYVGDTGNAGEGNYHLHFAIWLITDPKHYWDGVDLNPYPLLRDQP